MELVEHLGELRKRIMWVLGVLVAGMAGGLFFAKPIIEYLQHQPMAEGISLHTFSPWDAIRMYMNVAFLFGFILTLPVLLYHIWAFVSPGLRQEERSASLPYIPAAVLLFLVGISFGYFIVFRMAFYFTVEVTRTLDLVETYGIAQYFSFMFNILLPMGLCFEIPILVMFLTRIRILTPERLKKVRKYAYLLLVITSTVITPPDVISDIIVSVPLILLYEFSILMSQSVYRKVRKQDLVQEARYTTQ